MLGGNHWDGTEGASLSLDRSAKSPTPDYFEPLDEMTAGKYLTITRDHWRENYTATVVTQIKGGAKEPPRQSGDRMTKALTLKAKKAIENASLYTAVRGEGFRTFATLTLTPEWRAQLEKWDQMPRYTHDDEGRRIVDESRRTLGNLVAEFINVLQQRHRNGLTLPAGLDATGKIKNRAGDPYWKTADGKSYKVEYAGRWQPLIQHQQQEKIAGNHKAYTRTGSRVKAGQRHWFTREGLRYDVEYAGNWSAIRHNPKAFSYVWVIEMPKNDDAERNPHVHLMMNWAVKKSQFRRWARWIESTWGKGFVKLQKLRNPSSAAAYMAKAASYLVKGTDGSQGEVRGNRYSVSKNARPPKPEWLGRFRVTDELKDCMDAAQQVQGLDTGTGRKDMYFTKYAFGAKSRQAWGELCTTLKRAGYQFEQLSEDDIEWRPYTAVKLVNSWLRSEQRRYEHGRGELIDFSDTLTGWDIAAVCYYEQLEMMQPDSRYSEFDHEFMQVH